MPHGFSTTDGGTTWSKADFGNAVNKIRLIPTPTGLVGFVIGVQVHKLLMAAKSAEGKHP